MLAPTSHTDLTYRLEPSRPDIHTATRVLPPPIDAAVAVLRGIGSDRPRPLDADEANALAVIYRAYGDMLIAVARRFVGPDDAHDVVHDFFCRLPGLVVQYRGGGLGGWLRQCVVRAALMRLRTARRRRTSDALHDVRDSITHAAPVPADAHAVASDEIRWALERLPASLRVVVWLRIIEDHTHDEIGARLGISSAASEVRLCRAMRLLRQLAPSTDAMAPRGFGADRAATSRVDPRRRNASRGRPLGRTADR